MRGAVVAALGGVPAFSAAATDAATSALAASPDHVLVNVAYAPLTHLTRLVAAGVAMIKPTPPFVPGFDGAGTLADGTPVYFAFADTGTFGERAVVRKDMLVRVPDGMSLRRAAAVSNPLMASWLALTRRARIQPGETVLINGATGVSGQLAVPVARHLGARRVVVTGRNQAALDKLVKSGGADAAISLTLPPAELADKLKAEVVANGVDVVLDFLWGPSAEAILKAVAAGAQGSVRHTRFVNIGHAGASAGPEMAISAMWLRNAPLEILGSGIGTQPRADTMLGIKEALDAAHKLGLQADEVEVPIEKVAEAWAPDFAKGGERVVFKI